MGQVKRLLDTSAGALSLYSAELNECHRLLDTIGVPVSGYDEQLSISQRVAIAVGTITNLRHPMSIEGKRIGI